MVNIKPIEIFCGTGGVGKTTLATSRALDLASKGKKVLLITIDPAKRLKQILGLENTEAGKIQPISSEIFPGFEEKSFSFDALLMSPRATLRRMKWEAGTEREFDNPIIDILARPNGGMNEIMAIIEVQHHLSKREYDTIVLDTPPGKHFIDFLQASLKIKQFFDKSFIEIFKFLGKKFQRNTEKEGTGFFAMIVSSGVKKLLKYLQKVTGEEFVETFVDAVVAIYRNRDAFLEALKFQDELRQIENSNWFLVTSVEQHKIDEANTLHNKAIEFMHGDSYLTINKCLRRHLETWNPTDSDYLHVRNSMLDRENKIKEFAGRNFEKVMDFPEVLGTSPAQHVSELAAAWKES
ncbi:MAG: AAA family ATPase [Bacteriovoracaceae bacterium]|nr:AAA family ATPase [Bacteriovoracaceae bacterium]